MRSMLTILFLALFLSSCSSMHRCTCSPSYERTVNIIDSVVITTQEMSVPLPAEIATGHVAVSDTSFVQTSIAEAKAWVEDGSLHQQLRNRSDQLLKITLDVPVHIHIEKEYLTQTVTREVVKPLGWFKKTLMITGATAILAGVLALIGAIFHYRNKIIQLFKNL